MKIQKENKKRKKNQPLLADSYTKSTSKHSRSWIEKHMMTDPVLVAGETNEQWFERPTKMIPYAFCEGNKDKLFVEFHKDDAEYIHWWLLRISQEVAHKCVTFPQLWTYYNQVVNHKSTHKPLNTGNTVLSMATGLSINWVRDGYHYRFTKKQLDLIEYVFWFSHFHLRLYNHYNGSTALTEQDVGFNRKSKKKNEDLMPVLFVKQNKNKVDGRAIKDSVSTVRSAILEIA